jgi:hypothetical protein
VLNGGELENRKGSPLGMNFSEQPRGDSGFLEIAKMIV